MAVFQCVIFNHLIFRHQSSYCCRSRDRPLIGSAPFWQRPSPHGAILSWIHPQLPTARWWYPGYPETLWYVVVVVIIGCKRCSWSQVSGLSRNLWSGAPCTTFFLFPESESHCRLQTSGRRFKSSLICVQHKGWFEMLWYFAKDHESHSSSDAHFVIFIAIRF